MVLMNRARMLVDEWAKEIATYDNRRVESLLIFSKGRSQVVFELLEAVRKLEE